MYKFILIMLFAALSGSAMAEWLGNYLGKNSAINDVQNEAISVGAPTGFFNVKWLASMDDVRRSHPNALIKSTIKSNDTLAEREIFYGRDIEISYIFQDGNLVMFIINFTEPGSENEYQKTQAKLASEYGAMPRATPKRDCCSLSSSKNLGRFALEHRLIEFATTKVEQILVYRTKR